MTKLEELLEMWRKDAQIDRTQPNVELINIPQLHSKYLTIMSKHRLLSKEAEFKFNKYKKILPPLTHMEPEPTDNRQASQHCM